MTDDTPSSGRTRSLGLAFDGAVALAATGISASIFFSLRGPAGTADSQSIVVAALLAVHGLCLIGRRVRPLQTLLVNLVTGLAVVALGWPPVTLGIAVVIAVYSAGAGLPRRVSLLSLAAAEISVIGTTLLETRPPDFSTQLGNVAVLAVAWFIGDTIRSRRDHAANLERRNLELEAAREELAQKAVAEERVRIARELHDVIAHSLSVIAVQSGAGAHIIDVEPAEAKRALQVIETASRSTLVELRRVLGLLRGDDQPVTLTPAPSLEVLERLIEQVRNSGLDVELQRFGEARGLTPGAELTIFRIVQEALTNIIKHAEARRGRVVLSFEKDDVRVEVVDDGNSLPVVHEGNGLRGMRERVELYGGRLEVGPLPEGGFRVAASLPVDA